MNPDSRSVQLETTREIEVIVYPPIASSGCGGGMCSCGPDPTRVLFQRLDEIQGRFGDRLRVEVAKYRTDAQLRQAMDKLNLALKASDNDYLVSEDNLAVVLTTATPILIINNVIISSGSVPSSDMLSKYLESIV